MLTITLNKECLEDPSVLSAFIELSNVLVKLPSSDLKSVSSSTQLQVTGKPFSEQSPMVLRKKTISNRALIDMSPQVEEIDDWVLFLGDKQKEFVLELRKRKTLTLVETAQILGVENSAKNLKKHVNGLIGSIVRWSKSNYLTHVAKVRSTLSHKQIRFLPPWYCVDGVYYWQVKS